MTLAGIKLTLVGLALLCGAYFAVERGFPIGAAFSLAGAIFILFVLRHLFLYHRRKP